MNHAIIHGLWADPSFPRSMGKTLADLRATATSEARLPAIFYVFGRDNQKRVEDYGYETRLIDERPIVWYMPHFWRHKPVIWQAALADFDEILWIDLDVHIVKPWDEPAWQRLRQGPPLQAPLMGYRRGRATWRPRGSRSVQPSAAFVYCRERSIITQLLALMDEHNRLGYLQEKPPEGPTSFWDVWSEEQAMAWWIDQQMGSWQGIAAYCAAGYEPFCASHHKSPLPDGLKGKKDLYIAI